MKSSRPDAEVAAGEEATLQTLQFEGPEIHPALRTRPLDDMVRHLRQGLGMPEKLHISLPADVVKTVSHGRLNATGIKSVLDALYVHENEPGCCGMEAETLFEPCFLSRHQTSLADSFNVPVWKCGPACGIRCEQVAKRIWPASFRWQLWRSG